jgi:hypothetical protein
MLTTFILVSAQTMAQTKREGRTGEKNEQEAKEREGKLQLRKVLHEENKKKMKKE